MSLCSTHIQTLDGDVCKEVQWSAGSSEPGWETVPGSDLLCGPKVLLVFCETSCRFDIYISVTYKLHSLRINLKNIRNNTLKWEMYSRSVSLFWSAPNINSVCSGWRHFICVSFMKICSVVFIQSCRQTNKQTGVQKRRTCAPCGGNNHVAASSCSVTRALVLLSSRAGLNCFLCFLYMNTRLLHRQSESESAVCYLQLRRILRVKPALCSPLPSCSRKSVGIRRRSVCSDWPGWPRPLPRAADKSCLFETGPLLMNYNWPFSSCERSVC